MGSFRLTLALCVLYSHCFGEVAGINIGVIAVISFFVISGFVMASLIRRYYSRRSNIASFYVDRAIRIFPQYLFHILLTIFLLSIGFINSGNLIDFSPTNFLANLIIIPMAYYMYIPSLSRYIPPSWSLGLELTFYFFVPFYMLMGQRARLFIFLTSAIIAAIAYIGWIDTDLYGYRLLPGTFFIFASGAAIASSTMVDKRIVLFTMFFAFVGFFGAFGTWNANFNFEVTLGLLIGLPAVSVLTKLKLGPLDDFLGALSYGVFLNHFIILWLYNNFEIEQRFSMPVSSIALAILSYFLIERPAILWRHAWRDRKAKVGSPASS